MYSQPSSIHPPFHCWAVEVLIWVRRMIFSIWVYIHSTREQKGAL